jgi:hypothetical protein
VIELLKLLEYAGTSPRSTGNAHWQDPRLHHIGRRRGHHKRLTAATSPSHAHAAIRNSRGFALSRCFVSSLSSTPSTSY